jgi:ribosome-associated heat shock protein Hsp15
VAGRRRETRDETAADDGAEERQRLDKWLVYARFAKTRSVATALVEDGRVRVNGKRVTQPTRQVGGGDVLTLALPHATKLVRVLGAAERRGSFSAAQTLYEDLSLEDPPK